MAKQKVLYLTKGIHNPATTIANADGVAYKPLYTASVDDALINSLIVTSDDTVALNLVLAVTVGATDYIIGTVGIPAGSGTNGTAASVDLLSEAKIPGLPKDDLGKQILQLKGGNILKVKVLTAVAVGKTLTVVGQVEEY